MRKPKSPAKKKNPNAPPKRMHATGDRWYWKPERRLRPTWKSVPLGADFAAAAAEARRLNAQVEKWLADGAIRAPVRKARRMGPLSVGQLIAEYKASPRWKKLRPRTADQYVYEFKRLEQEFGHEPAATLSKGRVNEWVENLQMTAPQTARHVASKGRLLYAWAQLRELVPSGVNPFHGVALGQGGRRKMLVRGADLSIVVAACDAASRASLGTALVIAFACVQRISDVITLRDTAISGGRLRFHQSKGAKIGPRGELTPGFPVDMALPDLVARRLLSHPPKANKAGLLCPHDDTGAAWHEKTISRVFSRILAGLLEARPELDRLRGLQLRDGRRSGFVQYVLDGGTVELVCSMSGHSIEEGYGIVEHYLPKTPEQADRAVALLSVRL